MGSRTQLYDRHVEAGARIVDFGGWDMPLHYGSQKQEHHSVRNNAGVFDVSHMTIVDLHGEGVRDFLRHLLANDVAKLKEPGKALYTAMIKPPHSRRPGFDLRLRSPSRLKSIVHPQPGPLGRTPRQRLASGNHRRRRTGWRPRCGNPTRRHSRRVDRS